MWVADGYRTLYRRRHHHRRRHRRRRLGLTFISDKTKTRARDSCPALSDNRAMHNYKGEFRDMWTLPMTNRVCIMYVYHDDKSPLIIRIQEQSRIVLASTAIDRVINADTRRHDQQVRLHRTKIEIVDTQTRCNFA